MKNLLLVVLLSVFSVFAYSYENRDLLQQEAKETNIAQTLVKDFTSLDFPDYADREFWNNLPEPIRQQYIQEAEEYLDYDWPVVKATDYIEIIRSGDRKQEVYAAPRAALLSLVMGELAEGKGRFTDQIVNGAWYYSEQT